jgi:hypothetical protein
MIILPVIRVHTYKDHYCSLNTNRYTQRKYFFFILKHTSKHIGYSVKQLFIPLMAKCFLLIALNCPPLF